MLDDFPHEVRVYAKAFIFAAIALFYGLHAYENVVKTQVYNHGTVGQAVLRYGDSSSTIEFFADAFKYGKRPSEYDYFYEVEIDGHLYSGRDRDITNLGILIETKKGSGIYKVWAQRRGNKIVTVVMRPGDMNFMLAVLFAVGASLNSCLLIASGVLKNEKLEFI